MYNMIQSKVLKECDKVLTAEGIMIQLLKAPWCEGELQVKGAQASYFDDVVFCAAVEGASELLELAARMASLVIRVFLNHGMKLNFGKGKSEFALLLQGPGSNKARVELAKSQVLTVQCAGTEYAIQVTDKYKHMGGLVVPSGDLGPEIANRTQQARGAAVKSRTRFFSNPAYTEKARLMASDMLVESRLFYNAAVWANISPKLEHKLQSVRVYVWRLIKGMLNVQTHECANPHIPDMAIQAVTPRMNAASMVRVTRLRYLPRFLAYAPGLPPSHGL